jgi:hypothetical protein
MLSRGCLAARCFAVKCMLALILAKNFTKRGPGGGATMAAAAGLAVE